MVLDILTANLWGLPWPLARDRRARKRRFAEHLRSSAYHIIGIQELWWPWRRAFDFESLLLPESRRDSGLALAASLAVTAEPRVHHFERGTGVDRLKRKGVMSVRLRLDNGAELAVHVTHLQAGPTAGRLRARQVGELLDVVADDPAPAVVMGDFNFHAGDPDDAHACAHLGDAGFEDAVPDADAHTYVSSNPYVRRRRCAERFDRVFLKSGCATKLVASAARVLDDVASPFSDHFPLHVRVSVGA